MMLVIQSTPIDLGLRNVVTSARIFCDGLGLCYNPSGGHFELADHQAPVSLQTHTAKQLRTRHQQQSPSGTEFSHLRPPLIQSKSGGLGHQMPWGSPSCGGEGALGRDGTWWGRGAKTPRQTCSAGLRPGD